MRPYQRSLLEQPEMLIPIPIPDLHEMVILSRSADWDFLRMVAEEMRGKKVVSTRGQEPHYRALLGAVVLRSLKGCDLRTAQDLIANYIPARFLCDLHNSDWTPDHNTIWLFETMLGEEGLQKINDHVLRVAAEKGFADPKGLCADTTAQEANIPYPNEVGHMNSFAKSFRKNLDTLLKNSKGLGRKVIGGIKQALSAVAGKVRSHRLFAKTKEVRMEINKELLKLTSGLVGGMGHLLSGIDIEGNRVRGSGKRALGNICEIYHNMCQMLPQIRTWIEQGRVVPGKIISLFNTCFKAINRGKSGKPIEFGLKWGISQIRGGYVSIFMMQKMMVHDANYAVQSVREHIRIFGEPPRDFGFDRAAWSKEHMREISDLGVKNLGIAPKGKAKWKVGPHVQDRMIRERSQVEGKIGTMKTYGFNKSKAKTDPAVRQSAVKAGLCFNLKRLCKDLLSAEMTTVAQGI